MAQHYLDDNVVHAFWDNSYPPRVEIAHRYHVDVGSCQEVAEQMPAAPSDAYARHACRGPDARFS